MNSDWFLSLNHIHDLLSDTSPSETEYPSYIVHLGHKKDLYRIWGTFTRLQNKHFSVGFNCSWRDHSRTPKCCLRLSVGRGVVQSIGILLSGPVQNVEKVFQTSAIKWPMGWRTPCSKTPGSRCVAWPRASLFNRSQDINWIDSNECAVNLGEHMQKQPTHQRQHESPFILMRRKDCKHCDNYRSLTLTPRNASRGYLWNDSLRFL